MFEHLTPREMDILVDESLPWIKFCVGGKHHWQVKSKRFTVYASDKNWEEPPTSVEWRDAVAHFIHDYSAALMYLAWCRSRGHESILITDESGGGLAVLTKDLHMHPVRADLHKLPKD